MQFNSNTNLIAYFKMNYLHTLIRICILRYTSNLISYIYIF